MLTFVVVHCEFLLICPTVNRKQTRKGDPGAQKYSEVCAYIHLKQTCIFINVIKLAVLSFKYLLLVSPAYLCCLHFVRMQLIHPMVLNYMYSSSIYNV